MKFDDKSCEWIKGYTQAMGEIIDIIKHRINKDSPPTPEKCILTVWQINSWIGQGSNFILEELEEREEPCK